MKKDFDINESLLYAIVERIGYATLEYLVANKISGKRRKMGGDPVC